MNVSLFRTALIVAALASPAVAQEPETKRHPGFVDAANMVPNLEIGRAHV